jgi:glycosyltransferase involved in cell wall biosynthesis
MTPREMRPRGQRPLRVAQVVSSYHPLIGGVEKHVQCLAQGCAEAGDDVVVLTHRVGDAPGDEWIGGIRVLRFPMTVPSRNYSLSLRLFSYLRRHAADFDIVHVHSYHTVIGHAAVRSHLPFVFTPHYHGTGHTPFRAFLHRLYWPAGARLFRAADAVICVSDVERDLVIRDFPGTSGKAVTIPNGTSQKLVTPDDGDMVSLGDPVVLTVGRLERYKNVDRIIDAFRALPCQATLVVVGDGPDRARLERHAQATEPGWPVLFTGRVPDPVVDRLFVKAKVVVSASDHEAFGLTLAEGLVSGARVVASAIPAHAELARRAGPDAAVALVDPQNTRQFTDSLAAYLLADRVPTGSIRLPSWADVVQDTRELYSRVCAPGHPSYRRGLAHIPAARPAECRAAKGRESS